MPRFYDKSRSNLFGMHTDCLEDKNLSLAERGLLVTLLCNENKMIEEVLEELPNDNSDIKTMLQNLTKHGYVYTEFIDNEEVINISDCPIFKEG